MTRRDVCTVCCGDGYGNDWVADNDPRCIICEGSMHSKCASTKSVLYKDVREWLLAKDEYRDIHRFYDEDLEYSYEEDESINKSKDDIYNIDADMCPDCYEEYEKSKFCITCSTTENIEFCKNCEESTCKKCSCFNCAIKLPDFRKYLCDACNVGELKDIIKKFKE